MTSKASLRLAGALAAAVLVTACVGKYQSDFPVVIVNRTANSIAVIANGNELGQVAAGQSGNFSINTQETNANTFSSGVAPTPSADVVFSARDLKTGAISTTKPVTLTQSPPTYVTFNTTDFPAAVRTAASFAFSPNTPGPGQDVFFNAAASTGSNPVFAWTFGDGSTGTGVTTTHQFAQTGTFTVVLTVTSDNGASATQSRTVPVTAALTPTAATFTFSPTTPAINQDVVFTATNPIPGGIYTWDFGDGTANGSGATVTHRYTRAATYTVMMRVSTTLGQSASSTRTFTVAATPTGTINFTFSPTDPGVNDTVFFNASTTTIVNASFSWDFGDGARGSGAQTSHQYTLAHAYTVTLTVTNDLGQSVSLSKTVTVGASSFTVDFTFSPTNPTRNQNVIFDATPSSSSATSWTWDFGDGTTASGLRATHSFGTANVFVVRLTIADAAGHTVSTTKSVTVSQ
jgi:PKD repeat protein